MLHNYDVNLIFFALISLENNEVQQQDLLFISGKKHKILRHEWIQGWNVPLPGTFYCLHYSWSFPSIQDDFPPLLTLQKPRFSIFLTMCSLLDPKDATDESCSLVLQRLCSAFPALSRLYLYFVPWTHPILAMPFEFQGGLTLLWL